MIGSLSGRGGSKDLRDEPLDSVAQKLRTTVEMLRQFKLFGWIYIINKNGQCLLPAELAQKTNLIVRLRQERSLTWRQIGEVLRSQSSPYAAEEINESERP